ncbi:glycoside hydrolase family 43 protein [Streptococcus ovuberis]|uniref:Glycoside hydrolase family 43 protein n=1 Tax=Streptococcus ovuberis TaxID=1936207 RepID=A0A7X6RZY7_9STRE|nr:glycoside hydrolase family 43 protein [Streptococcus ovuberis]NKZ19534.1 glycoside hydrolase family 43 protein [Streptococcus ovuberis]
MKLLNPVIKGFNADPSIIRVEDTYYIANSTFEWFPGVQIHESKDLQNWELIAHPLSTVEHLDMKGNPDSGGIWAPDLSYADGKFWLIFTDVKVVEGPFKDCINYLTTAEDIRGPWSKPIPLNGVGFDASLFHDNDGKKYLVQMEWDHRPWNHPFHGIKLTEYDPESQKLLPETAKIIWGGTDVKLVEGPHIYRIDDYYYLFCAEGGTVYSHQEVVARSKDLFGPYESQPEVFLTAYDSPLNPLQKCGHGALVDTPDGEWFFAHLTGRPWHHATESIRDPRGWCTLGRETAIQRVEWDQDKWPYIVGGKQGNLIVEGPKALKEDGVDRKVNIFDDFIEQDLGIDFNTLRVPFTEKMGTIEDDHLVLKGQGSPSNLHDSSLVARRWQAFHFEAETKVSFSPDTYQQLAGLVNLYNSKHWSMLAITWDEEKGRVLDILEMDRGNLNSYLHKDYIVVPEEVEYIYMKTIVDKEYYRYAYSFDGQDWQIIPVELDAKILSDDYVNQTYGGFFTGAFVGMMAIDYSGYDEAAKFDYFRYTEREE